MDSEDKWVSPKLMTTFLEKHFKRCLSTEESEAILKDFPKPDCLVLKVPTLDEPVRDHLKRKGKDPHFGSEKTLYKLQGQVLNLAGPLTCLWADLLNADTKVKREDVLLLVQWILVLLGSLANSITQERRQISLWLRLNPLIKDFYLEEEGKDKKGTTLFGGGFLEKATKRVEEDKALAKVTGGSKEIPSAKQRQYSQDLKDLCRFLDKGAPALYGSGKQQRQQLYSRDHNPKGGWNPNNSRSSPSSNCSKQLSNSRYCMHLEQIKHCFILYSWPSVTAHGSQAALLLAQLESYHIRPMGATSGPGLLTGVESTRYQRVAPSPLCSQHQPAVEEEVQKLLTKGAIRKVKPCPGQFVSRLFLMAKKDGSFQPVVNLRPLNQFMARAHFKIEGINMLKDLLLENDWMASIDLKDAYLSVAVRTEYRKFLCFVWAEQTYEFHCLPFGLSSALRVFTKFLKPVVGLLRRQGIRLVIFLDDMLVLAQAKGDLVAWMDQIAQLFSLLGLSVNLEKSQLTPAQQIQFLGFLIDSQNLRIRLTQEKTE